MVRRREHGKFVPAGQVELMIGVAVLMVIAAIVIPNVLQVVQKSRRNRAIEHIVEAERTWRHESGVWFTFQSTAELERTLGDVDVACEFSAVAEAGSSGALTLTVLCPHIDSMPIERKIDP